MIQYHQPLDGHSVDIAPELSVIIATCRRARLLATTLRALAVQTLPQQLFEVIVVADGSTDGTDMVIDRARTRLPLLRTIHQPQRGPASARNAGIRIARGRILAFTDDDCIPGRDWLRSLLQCYHDHPDAIGVEGKTITDQEKVTPLTHQVVNLRGGRSRPTCNVSYLRAALLEAGGFDERYVFNGEDEDIALAIAKLGQIVFCESAVVIHPPRRMRFRDHLRRIARLELQAMICEFRLAHKHPAGYRRLRGGGPWRSIFYLTALLRLYELWENRGWLRTSPGSWFAAALLLCARMLYRLALTPIAYLRWRAARAGGVA